MTISVLSVLRPGVIAFGGSRHLSDLGKACLGQLAFDLAFGGFEIVTGDCVGADAAVVSALSGSASLAVLTVVAEPPADSAPGSWCGFSWAGFGVWAKTAEFELSQHWLSGGQVVWLAGGPLKRPLIARLSVRTRAVARAASGGAVVAFGRMGPYRGSLLLSRSVAARGLPVVGFSWGGPPPLLGAGRWSVLGPCSWVWVSAVYL